MPNVVDPDLFSFFVNSKNHSVDMGLMAIKQIAQLAESLVAFRCQWATVGQLRETFDGLLKTIEPARIGS